MTEEEKKHYPRKHKKTNFNKPNTEPSIWKDPDFLIGVLFWIIGIIFGCL